MNTIFVSSTFRDMHFERDAIQELVYPKLNQKAQEYGQSVSFCDLRWGIDTSELESDSGSKKVLDVCLDEIDRCEPPMVVMLGYRYGWIPSEHLIQGVAEKYNLKLGDLEKSVTALEIEYGSLRESSKLKNTLFYFREIEGDVPEDYLSEDTFHKNKINELKEKIKELTNHHVKTYTLCWNGSSFDGIKEFADLLSSDLEQIFLPRWNQFNDMTPFDKELYTHNIYKSEKGRSFRARKSFADHILTDIKDGNKLTIIKAASGSGKSTLFSHLADELEKDNWNVLNLFSGLTAASNTSLGILQTMIDYTEQLLNDAGITYHLGSDVTALEETNMTLDNIREKALNTKANITPEKNIKQLQKHLNELCVKCTSEKIPVMFMLDAADQLYDDTNRDELIFIPTELSEYVRFVMTCLPELSVLGNHYIEMHPINNEDKQDVIEGILSMHNRELAKEVIQHIFEIPASDNPLYLSFLIQRLLMMNKNDFEQIHNLGDGMDAITRYQLQMIQNSPDNLEEMSAELIRAASERIGGNLVEKAMNYLAVSKHGLRINDLAGIMQTDFNMLDFAHFISYMNDCFIIREDGRYDFSHKSIREGLLKRCKNQKKYHFALAAHFLKVDEHDVIRKKEVTMHLIKSDLKEVFANYIAYFYDKDKETTVYAAQDTYALSNLDNGTWLYSVLDADIPDHYRPFLLHFIGNEYFKCMTGYFSGGSAVLKVMKRAFEMARDRLDDNKSIMNGEIYADILESYAKLLTLIKDENAEYSPGILMSTSIHYRKQLADIKKDHESMKTLALSYQTYSMMKGETLVSISTLEKAAPIYQKLYEELQTEASKKDLADYYLCLAKKYSGIMIFDEDKLVNSVKEAVNLYEELYKEYGNIQYKYELSKTYLVLADGKKYSDKKSVQETYQIILDLLDDYAKETNSISTHIQKGIVYNQIVDFYQDDFIKWDETDNAKEKSLFHAKQAVNIFHNIWMTMPSIENRRNLAIAYENLGKVYWSFYEYNQWKECINPYSKAADLRNALYEDTKNDNDAYSLLLSYNNISDAYERITREKYGDYSENSKKYKKLLKNHERYDYYLTQRKSFSEVIEIFRHMDKFYIESLPARLIMHFYNHCELDYDFRMTKSIADENLMDETLRFISMINENFWSKQMKKEEV